MKKKKKTAVVKRAATVTAMAAAQRKGHKVGAAQGYKSRRGGVVHKRQDDRPAGKKSTGHQQRNNKLATKGVRPNLISVIMPLYNYEQYVGRAIESIINQTHQDWELIIIDDGSTDGSAAAAAPYVKKDKRIRYYYQANRGEYSARNHGLRKARGQYIAWQDADDTCHPERLARQLQFLQQHDDVAICGVGCDRIDTHGVIFDREPTGQFYVPYRDQQGRPRHPLINKARDYEMKLIGATTMVRKECFAKLGFYRPFEVGTDYDMLLRLEEYYKMVNLPDYLYGWRLHSNTSIVRVKKYGYHGRLGISLNRLVATLSCLARRYGGIDPLAKVVGQPLDSCYWPAVNRPLARPRLLWLFWRTPPLWRYIPAILSINRMSLPEFIFRLLWVLGQNIILSMNIKPNREK